MKRTGFLACFTVMLAVILLVFPSTGFAQAKIGYIDSQKILSTYAPAIDADKQLETESNKWGEELQKMENDFQTQREELEKQSLLLSEEKKLERQQELQTLALEAQKYQNDKWGEQGEYFKMREQLLKPIIDKINGVINQVGEDDGYDFIFDTVAGNLVFAKDKFDLTNRILEELEKEKAENTKANP